MLAERILEKSASTSTGANLRMKFSSQLGAMVPFLGMIVKGPASRIPVYVLTILKLKSRPIAEVFLIVNLRLRVAYIKVGLMSSLWTEHW